MKLFSKLLSKPLLIPAYPRRLSLITLVYGIGVFLWLSPEDSVWLVALLGTGLSLILTAHAVFKLGSGRRLRARVWFPGAVALGAIVGMGAALMTMLLMLMKTAVHNHLYPDYSFGVMAGIFQRVGAWAVAGALVGLAGALLLSIRRS